MRTGHTFVVTFAVAVVIVLVASAARAQTPTSESPSRARLIEQAREALVSQSAPPERSSTERRLYWYDNQFVLAKLFAGWKGIRVGGGDFPAGAGLKFGVAYDKPLTSADPDPTIPNRIAIAMRGAYSTRGYA